MSENTNFTLKIYYKLKRFFYFFYGEKFFKKKRYDWGSFPKRYEILQEIIDFNNYKTYLEIGCDKNQSFSHINIKHRVGVDPVEGGTHKMTSDEFFLNNKNKFDIIFIDGLHEYRQVFRDIQNSLKFLNNNGVILLHDCLPRTIWNQITPRINEDWNGDVWKAIVHCRTIKNIDTYTILADRGLGIIFPRNNKNKLDLHYKTNFKNLKFEDYYNNHQSFMNIINYDKLKFFNLFK